MLKLTDVTVKKNGRKILDIKKETFDFSKRYAIYGHSGSGKTTLFELITGIQKPCKGDVEVNNSSLYDSDFIELSTLRKKMGVMFDLPGLISNQNVYENICLAVNSKKLRFKSSLKNILTDKYLTPFKLESVIELRPGLLTIEQKRIISFIRAIISKPEFLIFDGFSDFISGEHSEVVKKFLMESKEQNIGGIFFCKNKEYKNIEFDNYFELKNGCLYEL